MATDSTPYVHGSELDRLGGRVALGGLDMLFSTPEWIHRRVEKVELTTGLPHFRRRVSLDLTLPNPDITGIKWTDSERVTLVPVDVLAKQPLRRFSIIDAEGRPLPVLTRRQNGEIAWRGMESYAQQVLSSAGAEPMDSSLSESLKVMTQGTVPAALAETEALLSRPGRSVEALAADDGFAAAAGMLARNFALIAVLAPAPGRRQILKYEYEYSSASDRDDRTRRERILESFGWSPTIFEVPAPSFMDCETFHAEVTAPEGIELLDIVLGDEHESRRSPDGTVDDRWTLGYSRVLSTSPHLAHLSTSRTADPDANPDEFIDPRLSVRLRVERDGWLRSSALAALFVAVFFTASLHFITEMSEQPEGLNTDPAAFTVALLSVISLGVTRVGEHGYTARLLRHLRMLALVAAVLPIAAAWLLVFPGPGRILSMGWIVLVVVSWLFASVLAAVWRAPQG